MGSALKLSFVSRLNAAELGEACLSTLKANRLEEASVRLAVSAGEGESYPDPSTCREPTIFVTARQYIPPSPKVVHRGFSVVFSSLSRDSRSLLSQIKSASYLISYLARAEARTKGADEALLLNERGFLAEGSVSNLFLVKEGMLLTPDLGSGALPGITRQVVLELADSLGVKTAVRELSPEELYEAEEALLTNSLFEVMPLTRVNDKAIGSGKHGEITARLRAAYHALVEREIGSP
jgi:branched-subunit amino acid aminotransferase/4-amino-4-deoxychorismate lyase